MSFVLGLDGGGTRSSLAVASLDGEVLARADAGPLHPGEVGAGELRERVRELRLQALRRAGLEPSRARAACLGLAGAGDPALREELLRELSADRLAPTGRLRLFPDYVAAHSGAFAREAGIVVVVGTGSVVYGRSVGPDPAAEARAGGREREARAGGWGPPLNDPASASWLAIEWLRLAAQVVDGLGRATPALQRTIDELRHAGLRGEPEVVQRVGDGLRAWIRSARGSRAAIAALAPRVTLAAEAGDSLAGELLLRGCRELAREVAAVARRLAQPAAEVAAVGGLMRAGPIFVGTLARALQEELPRHRPRPALLTPLGGALLEALALAGRPIDRPLVARLREKLDPRAEIDPSPGGSAR